MAGNIMNIFDEFRNSSPDLRSRYPVPFDKLPEDTVNKLRTYEEFLDYLAKEYLNKEGRQAGEPALARLCRPSARAPAGGALACACCPRCQ
jgi:hypothetical protein